MNGFGGRRSGAPDSTPGTAVLRGGRHSTVTIIIPAYNAQQDIAACLAALEPSRGMVSEIVVVDDGSTDETARIARRLGARVVATPNGRGGPAIARNTGIAATCGDVIIFVDADVCVHPGAVGRALAILAADPELGAVSGSYDDEPSARGDLSTWRNLLHCYTHHTANPDTRTFWTGFGAIRREHLERLGGFDPDWAFIEDMDVGARLSEAGIRLRLERALLAKHRKRWTFLQMIHTDVVRRAVPYTRLIERYQLADDLNVNARQRTSVTLVWAAALLLGFAFRFPPLLWCMPFAAVGLAWLNRDFYSFLAARRGVLFPLRMFPLHILFFFYSGCGFLYGRFGCRVLRRNCPPHRRRSLLSQAYDPRLRRSRYFRIVRIIFAGKS